MGPLISAQQRSVVQGYVDEVEVAFTGSTPDGPGFWVPPTVVHAESTDMRIWREEVFGPVVAVMPFDDEADAVAKANDTEYGLSGSIFTADVGRGAAGRPRRPGRQPLGELALRGPLLDPLRRLQAVRPRPRARTRRPNAFTDEKNVFIAQ